MSQRVASRVESASLLCADGVKLLIPSYQRPYVWPVEDVVQLLDDIVAACDAGEEHYYIGTIISAGAAPTHAGPCLELVDGQQRMTTLMLLALALRKVLPDAALAGFTTLGAAPRLSFRIRDRVQAYLGAAAGLENYCFPDEKETDEDDYLAHLHRALKAADAAVARLRSRKTLAEIADYLFTRVKWVNNTVPAGVNLNHLFAKINTSGLQLEQSDILKSQLLRKIGRHKARYEAMWQACENMNNYFERNVRKVFPDADWEGIGHADLMRFDPGRFTSAQAKETELLPVSLAYLVRHAVAAPAATAAAGKSRRRRPVAEDEKETLYCRSIISFSLLLMHTYRIYLARQGQGDIATRMNVARFGECFAGFAANATEGQTCAFIECLWEVRYQFDAWVVKWVGSDNDEEVLRLQTLQLSRDGNDGQRLSRRPSESSELADLAQLQAVRNFTGERSAQYWLTVLLGRLAGNFTRDASVVLHMMEDIDDALSLARLTQKEASFALLAGIPSPRDPIGKFTTMLTGERKGTQFEHYWFQKLEYILWKNRRQLDFEPRKLERFRISSKNSVEHVHPQRHEFRETIGELLDSFGNLVLLSPGENSSYSNLDPKIKRVYFDKKPTYDSLKLACMFHRVGDGDWREGITAHLDDMVGWIARHYARCGRGSMT